LGNVGPRRKLLQLVVKSPITALKGIVRPPAASDAQPADQRAWAEYLRVRLSITLSVVNVCAAALEAQAAGIDLDTVAALRRCVSDVLSERIEQLERMNDDGAS
jgi:hypothetical protein